MDPKFDTKQESIEDRFDLLQEELNDLADDIEITKELGYVVQSNPEKLKLFKARLSRIDSIFSKFATKTAEARCLARSLDKFEDINRLLQQKKHVYDDYYEALSLDDCTINKSTSSNISQIRLPKIPLPIFSGELSDWNSFKDMYVSLIHSNSTLQDVHKFYYLRTCLKGMALQSISSIPFTAGNYVQAWECLKKRFGDKRLQANNYLTKIFNFQSFNNTSLSTFEAFSNEFLQSAIGFRNLKIPDEAGFIILTYALRLLDQETREKFEYQLAGKSELPTLQDFINFINKQISLLQMESLYSNSPGVPSSTTSGCPMCEENHSLGRCSTFIALNPIERYEKVKDWEVCTNCLSKNHKRNKCTSVNVCRRCNKKHHSLLHFS